MQSFIKPVEIRWSDLDPNFHLRHSVYYDYGAYCRICFFEDHGLSTAKMQEIHFGPILFREEAVFRKEIRMGDVLTIDLQVTKSRKDYSRWSIRHQLMKNGDILSAVISVDGAWINTELRKLATPPPELTAVFEIMPKSEDFVWV
ncbi:MAG TPA: thioesterase family protein [Puia sp.]|nr:thioesterase family protein [Puia sp.]